MMHDLTGVIAAILPLLGTEQCSVQVSSANTQGYLYAAATPMSIFGSFWAGHCGIQDIGCLLLIGGY